MTDLRTAAQQALEALHEIGWSNDTRWQSDRAATVIPALRAALAEPNRAQKMRDAGYTRRPTLREMAESEPCQYPDCVDNGPDVECTRWLLDECSMREDYKPKRPAEPVQEPVAWMYDCGNGGRMYAEELDGVPGWMPLCTTPPQRKPLSEDEIFAIENDIPDDVISDRAWTICFARAVEAAHGIKEGI